MYIPFASQYAKYLPSGEIPPLVPRFSKEFVVSCRNFNSAGRFLRPEVRLANQKAPLVMSSMTTLAADISLQRTPCLNSLSRFGCSRALLGSQADSHPVS